MATLEKIRNKSVLLFVIIIVALLAFILGDFLTSGRTYFGSPTTVAKAGEATVEYNEYQNRISQAGEQMRQQGRDYSSDVLSQQVVQGLLIEKLFQNEYNTLGITVTDREITDAMTGANPHPAAQQMISYLSQMLQLPAADGRAVYDAIANPAKYSLTKEQGEQLRQIWANQEKELEAQMLSEKFSRLVAGLYTYNKLDAKAMYDDAAQTRHISYAVKDASGVSDEDAGFNADADAKAMWAQHKKEYAVSEPTREISYIYVAIEPSQEDRIAGQQAVEEAIVALNEKEGTEGVANNSRFVTNTVKVPASAITDAKLRSFVEESEAGTAKLIERNGDAYTIAKLLSVSQGIDSLQLAFAQVGPTVNADSIAALLNSGKTVAEIADGTTVGGQDEFWISLEAQSLDQKTKDALMNAAIGNAFVLRDTIQGTPVASVYKVKERHAPVKFYEIADIEYIVDPSSETLANLTGDLRTYTSNNSSAAEFSANGAENGYSILTDQITASSSQIGNARDSRRMIKWIMDAKEGQVSPIFQDDKQTYLLAVAVNDTYDDYIPYTSPAINTQVTTKARNSKKADKLMAEYNGKANTVEEYAQLMGVEVAEGDVNISSPILLSIGVNESALQGAIAAAEKDQVVGPVKGNRCVMVFKVTEINDNNRPMNDAEYGQRFTQLYSPLRGRTPLPLLLGNEKVDNRSLNFVQEIGE